jgi:hypothetical protein
MGRGLEAGLLHEWMDRAESKPLTPHSDHLYAISPPPPHSPPLLSCTASHHHGKLANVMNGLGKLGHAPSCPDFMQAFAAQARREVAAFSPQVRYTHIHVYVHMYIYVCMYVYIYIHIYIYAHTYIYIHICMHTSICMQ